MFKNILIPTDGSRLAAKGVRTGLGLAKKLGAKVTAVYVIFPYIPPMYGEAAIYFTNVGERDYKAMAGKHAAKVLAAVEEQARAAGVRCASETVTTAQPWEGILKVARARKCDAISMASHGRGGMGGLILGSETTQVLARSKIPVIVSR